jgi:hypothetical protein
MTQQSNKQLTLDRAEIVCVQHLKTPLDDPGVEEIEQQPQLTDLQALMQEAENGIIE